MRERKFLFILAAGALAAACNSPGKQTADNTPIIDIPDQTFKASLTASFDKNGDGEISQYEASFIKEIDTVAIKASGSSADSIQDLTGIEHFANLKKADFSNQRISDFDLSANTKLEELVLDGNPVATLQLGNPQILKTLSANNLDSAATIEEIAIAGFPKLETLLLNNSPNFKKLDIENVSFQHNALNRLELEGNGTIMRLRVANTNLRTLNAVNMKSLASIIATKEQVDAYNNGSLNWKMDDPSNQLVSTR